MKKWEYKIVKKITVEALDKELFALGGKGWELVEVMDDSPNKLQMILKRPKRKKKS